MTLISREVESPRPIPPLAAPHGPVVVGPRAIPLGQVTVRPKVEPAVGGPLVQRFEYGFDHLPLNMSLALPPALMDGRRRVLGLVRDLARAFADKSDLTAVRVGIRFSNRGVQGNDTFANEPRCSCRKPRTSGPSFAPARLPSRRAGGSWQMRRNRTKARARGACLRHIQKRTYKAQKRDLVLEGPAPTINRVSLQVLTCITRLLPPALP